MGKALQELTSSLCKAIRVRAATIPDFDRGTITLSFIVESNDGDRLLYGACDEDGFDIADVSLTYGIRSDCRKTRLIGYRGMGSGEVANKGYAALKIEGCDYAVRNNRGRRSCDMPEKAIVPGRVNDRGAVCFDVMKCTKTWDRDDMRIIAMNKPWLILRIFVDVSGASGEENEWCALAAGDILKEWASAYDMREYVNYPDGLHHKEHLHNVIEPEPEKEAE